MYVDLYVQSDTLLLANVFDNSQNMWLEIYELDPIHFLFEPGLSWKGALKKAKVKLDLFADIDMLLIVEQSIQVEYVMLFIDMRKLITNT